MSDKSEAIHEMTKSGTAKAGNFFGAIGRFIKKHKLVTALLMFIIIAAIVFMVVRARLNAAAGAKLETQLQTTSLAKMDLSTSVSVTGTIASADARSVSADVKDIEVLAVNVAVGDYVNAGDTIITLDSADIEEELETAQESYDLESTKTNKTVSDAQESIADAQDAYTDGVSEQAAKVSDALSQYNQASSAEADRKAEYEKAQEQTEQAQKAYEALKEEKSARKAAVNKAKKANEKAQSTLAEAKAAYEAAQVTAKDANGNVDTAIYQTYIDAQAAAEQTQADMDKAQKEYDGIEEAKNAYANAQKAEEEALAAYESAASTSGTKYAEYEKSVSEQTETNEKNAEAIEDKELDYTITSKEASSSLKSQSSQVQETQEKLGECVVTSPISGVITSISVEAGDTYDGSELFTVQDMTAFVVDATVDEYDISDIAKDMAALVKTDATDEDELNGVVTYVAPTPESTTSQSSGDASSMGSSSSSSSASYKIQITLSDTDDRLRVGMTAKTSIVLDSAQDVFALPYDCVKTDEDGSSYITVVGAVTGQSTQEEGAGSTEKEAGSTEKEAGSTQQKTDSTEKKADSTEKETDSTQQEAGSTEQEAADEKPQMPEGEMPNGSQSTRTASTNQSAVTRITVEKGMESDYYVQVIADSLKEGMQVVVPTTAQTAAGSSEQTGFSINALTGGGRQSGEFSGGGPNGAQRGAPGGF